MKLRRLSPNAVELIYPDRLVLVSYSAPVAVHIIGVGHFRTDRQWSKPTMRHVTRWLELAPAYRTAQGNIEALADGRFDADDARILAGLVSPQEAA